MSTQDTNVVTDMTDAPTEEPESTPAPDSDNAPAEDSPPESTDTQADPNAAADAAPDEEPGDEPSEEGDDLSELDDETIEALADAYGDRLRKTKTFSDRFGRQVKDEVSRQVREQTSLTTSRGRSDDLISQGKLAAEKVQQLATVARDEIGKANIGDEKGNPDILDSRELVGSLEQYGSATAMYERHVLETATQDGFDHVFGEILPELSDEHVDELKAISTTVNRMRSDPSQYSRADSTWMTQLLEFIAQRAMDHGAVQERQRVSNRGVVKGKIAGTNAVAAAKAKIEASRAPPRTPKSEPKSPVTEFSEKGYQEIKRTGKPEEIQNYVDQWASRRSVGR